MNYFNILDDGTRTDKKEFSNIRKSDCDKNEYCCLWHYNADGMELLGRFTVPVNIRSVAHKLPNLKVHQMLGVFESGYLILSEIETIQIEPE